MATTTTLEKTEAMRSGELVTKRGICGICPAGCWVEVGLRDGRLETIAQDETHALGMICRRGRHAPEIIYSENRLRHPMKRKGPKGTHEFERISWDDAYELIVQQLQRIKTESGPEAVSISTDIRAPTTLQFELLSTSWTTRYRFPLPGFVKSAL